MLLKERIVFAFNKFYSNLIKDLKESSNDLKLLIKKNYKVVDKMSTEYCDFYINEFKVFDNPESHILKDITVQQVITTLETDNEKDVFWNYIYILAVISYLYTELSTSDDETQIEILFKSIINILGLIQKQNTADATAAIEEILDDDIKQLLLKIKIVKEMPPSSESDPFNDLFGKMGDSKICNLAKEISKDIDVSSIKADSPEDLFKMMDFSSSNNVLGDIIKKVSTKIHDKISNGEIKQEDLFGEAMSMMGMMGGGGKPGGSGGSFGDIASMMGGMMNNPMVSEMMKMAKKGKAVPKTDGYRKADVKERLRIKLEERKKK
jgi:hypothetical protein